MLASAMPLVEAHLLGHALTFQTTPGLFSADRVDDGTRLLLVHLPPRAPASVLDLGCGWGALGLPIARTYPEAACLLLDRDALAAAWADRNAKALDLPNVVARPGLGYRDVEGRFDWVLCNVPARIGQQAIEYIVGAGAARLTGEGELRVVVIRDLDPVMEAIAQRTGWPLRKVGKGSRHSVWASAPVAASFADHESFYLRDRVEIGGRTLDRPHDVNEDHDHLTVATPLLLECLPRKAKTALAWRCGYGAVTATLRERGTAVTAADRDLLALAFTRRNSGGAVELRPAPSLEEALCDASFDAIVGEHVPSAGEAVARAEWQAAVRHLARGGTALWLGRSKAMRPALERTQAIQSFRLAARGAWEVVRLSGR